MIPFINYLKTGGGLMIPIIIVAFLLWQRYFASMAALKSGCPAELVAHELRFMAALVAAAPLLGLLGTVIGMIDTFHAAAMQSVAADPAALANGIGKA
ncbi:MAG: MotA/TolQ/ExbB proton channel family protein, partial [Victivallales bacterium]|nr:MotA/TolQ/ExbB proton channel family protein [Victivallales bacterium]